MSFSTDSMCITGNRGRTLVGQVEFLTNESSHVSVYLTHDAGKGMSRMMSITFFLLVTIGLNMFVLGGVTVRLDFFLPPKCSYSSHTKRFLLEPSRLIPFKNILRICIIFQSHHQIQSQKSGMHLSQRENMIQSMENKLLFFKI